MPSGKYERQPYDAAKLFARIFKRRIIDPVTGCWLWPAVDTGGYGQMFFDHNGRKFVVRMHRLSAWLYLGYDGRESLVVCHKCNIKACFNPAHLYLGSPEENRRDAIRDGLLVGHKKGVEHYEARFTEAQVQEVRLRAAKGESNASLGREFGVNRATIRRIVVRQTWKHITETIQ